MRLNHPQFGLHTTSIINDILSIQAEKKKRLS